MREIKPKIQGGSKLKEARTGITQRPLSSLYVAIFKRLIVEKDYFSLVVDFFVRLFKKPFDAAGGLTFPSRTISTGVNFLP